MNHLIAVGSEAAFLVSKNKTATRHLFHKISKFRPIVSFNLITYFHASQAYCVTKWSTFYKPINRRAKLPFSTTASVIKAETRSFEKGIRRKSQNINLISNCVRESALVKTFLNGSHSSLLYFLPCLLL